MVDFPAAPLKLIWNLNITQFRKGKVIKSNVQINPSFGFQKLVFSRGYFLKWYEQSPPVGLTVGSEDQWLCRMSFRIYVSDHPTMNPSLFELGWFHPTDLNHCFTDFSQDMPKKHSLKLTASSPLKIGKGATTSKETSSSKQPLDFQGAFAGCQFHGGVTFPVQCTIENGIEVGKITSLQRRIILGRSEGCIFG